MHVTLPQGVLGQASGFLESTKVPSFLKRFSDSLAPSVLLLKDEAGIDAETYFSELSFSERVSTQHVYLKPWGSRHTVCNVPLLQSTCS